MVLKSNKLFYLPHFFRMRFFYCKKTIYNADSLEKVRAKKFYRQNNKVILLYTICYLQDNLS